MEKIRAADFQETAPRPQSARLAAGAALILAAVTIALPYWAALALWIGTAFLFRSGAALARLVRDTLLFAGDMALGERRRPVSFGPGEAGKRR